MKPGKIIVKLLFILLFFPGINSCAKVDSEDLKSSGLRAIISAIALGDGNTRVEAEFHTGSDSESASVELSNEDELTVSAEGSSYSFRENSGFLSDVNYEATIYTDAGGTELRVSLERANDVSAPNSIVTLPEGMTIDLPNQGDVFYSGDRITVNWSPSVTGEIEIDYDILCVNSFGGSTRLGGNFNIPDSGIFAVNVDYLLAGAAIDTSFPCSATITLTRTNIGILDPNYGKGGTIHASQIREVSIAINPS